MDDSEIVDVYRGVQIGDKIEAECLIEYHDRSQTVVVKGEVIDTFEGGAWEDSKAVVKTGDGRIYDLVLVGLGGPSIDLHRVGDDNRYFIDTLTALDSRSVSGGGDTDA